MPTADQTRRQDVDEVAVYRRVNGDRTVPLNVPEREEAVRTLHHQGHSDKYIAMVLGHDPRVIFRIRKRLNLPPNFEHGRTEETS